MMPVLFAFLLTVLFTVVFTLGFLRRGVWSSALAFFVIVFLSAWAASLWLGAIGPIIFGMYWVPTVFVALVVAALLAWRHVQRERQRDGPAAEARQERAHELAFNLVFWLTALIILGYLFGGPTPVPTP
jgi:tetrahydromethanopterin S-methyltransferase subunit E